MAGRSSKKKQDNFEKIKREMAAKKQKAQAQYNPETAKVDNQNDDLMTVPGKDCTVQAQDKHKKELLENNDAGKSDAAAVNELEADIVEKAQQDKIENTVDMRKIDLVVFRVDEEEFALRISNIREIIRVPPMTKVPNAPQYITGMCNMRGELLPVIDSRKLFGMPDQELNESSRIIVADIHGRKVGLLSDKVSEVMNVEESAVKEPPAGIKGIDGETVNGILILNNGKRVVMILDAEKIVRAGNFDAAAIQQRTPAENITDSQKKEDEEEQIVIFNIGLGEYAFRIDCVKEIIRMPEVMKVPNTASYIEGVFSVRNQLLAVINPGKLFGMNCKQPDEHSRVVIVNNGSFTYGVIVDKVSHVTRVRKELFRESAEIGNCSGAEFVKGVFSLNNGKRLVMLLEPNKLASLEDMKDVLDAENKISVNDQSLYTGESDNNLEHVVVFKLGEEEYGIEINYVQEINRMSKITHFPGAPSFIAGMVDLRGDIIPILNLRRLFNLNNSDSYNKSKFMVVEYANKKIGILIDSVSEVLRFSKAYSEKAPEAIKGNGQDSYIDKIAKLNDGKRIVLMLNLSTLLRFM